MTADRNAERTTAPIFVEEYRTIDKSEWGPGPWQDEPDKAVWVDELTGLDCMIHRGPLGALCGYVGVPEGHLAHGKDYGDVDVDVHGSLTYAAECWNVDDPAEGICHIEQPGRPTHVWWLGFDCGHGFDVLPRMAADYRRIAAEAEASGDMETAKLFGRDLTAPWFGTPVTYKPVSYVVAEVRHLADQLAEVGATNTTAPRGTIVLDVRPKDGGLAR